MSNQDLNRFAGKAVIVTGAAGSIGRAIARRFAAEGADVLMADIDGPALAEAAAGIAQSSADIATTIVDVATEGDNERMVAIAVERFGRLDVLVNNAAIGVLGKITELKPEDWRRVFAVGLDSVFYASRAAIPHLKKTQGSIINTGSISGLYGDHGLGAYNAMKGAVANLTRSLALDHAEDGVRVNTLAPGAVRADTPKAMAKRSALSDALKRNIPLGRVAEPDDVAGAAAFLASDDARYITGINLVIDGGLTAATGQPNILKALAAMAEER